MANNIGAEYPTTLVPEDWPSGPEHRYAKYQVRFADHYDLDVDSPRKIIRLMVGQLKSRLTER